MRIVIVGDLQYEKNERIDGIAADVNSLLPDVAVLLGDYGYWDGFGSYEVFAQIASAFRDVPYRVIPLLGNHDVQYEAGEWKFRPGTVAENYKKAFGYLPENQVLEFEDFRIFCLHTDCQKKGDFWFKYECYMNNAHFEELKAELEKYPDKPVIMITHAPPAGCGLLTVPEVHVRASNAYLDQDHGYERWVSLARDYRQIVMWFNGHYHMGHKHRNSISVRDGLAYFVTGVATSQSRDGQKHSRVIDVKDGIIKVSTYDHERKELSNQPDYMCGTKIRGNAEPKDITGVFKAGCGRVVSGGLKRGANGRIYAMTDNGFLWEIDAENRIAAGTLHYSDKYKLDGFVIDSEYVWRICGDTAFGHRYDDLNRFMREKDCEDCAFVVRSYSELPLDLGEPLEYEGRPVCRFGAGLLCAAFNDSDGTLCFEMIQE